MGTLFIFFQRKMYWREAIIIANLMPWVFPYVAWIGGNDNRSVGLTKGIEMGSHQINPLK
jgi:hypothetical protein